MKPCPKCRSENVSPIELGHLAPFNLPYHVRPKDIDLKDWYYESRLYQGKEDNLYGRWNRICNDCFNVHREY